MKQCLFIVLFLHISIVKAEPTWEKTAEGNKKQLLYYGQQYVNSARPDFECEGIVTFDAGAAMDMPIYFAEANPRKFLCSSSMGGSYSVDPNDTCPPSAWVKSGCADKYGKLMRRYRKSIGIREP